ncbi:MAG: hypothetical protein KGZ86_05210 [Candidatus Latescibacteria bacterium]|nr:hypothetical protein [Candidatus Latescibacterota bacterium]
MIRKILLFLISILILLLYAEEYEQKILVEGTWKKVYPQETEGLFGFSTDPPGSGPRDFCIDPITGDIYIRDWFWDRIQVFDSSGKFAKTLPLGYIGKMHFDNKGNIYTISSKDIKVDKRIYGRKYIEVGVIRKYDRNWNLLAEWDGEDKNSPLYPKIYAIEKIAGSDYKYFPWQIINFRIGNSGYMYIESGINLVLDEDGKLVYWGKAGKEYILEDPQENVYIYKYEPKQNNRILACLGKLEKGDFPKSEIWEIDFPYNLPCIDKEGKIYVFDGERKIKKFDNELNLLSEIEVKSVDIIGCRVGDPIVDDKGNIYQVFSKYKDIEEDDRKSIQKMIDVLSSKGEPVSGWQKSFENKKYLSEEEKNLDGFRIYKWVKK